MKPTLLVLAAGLGTRYGGLKQIDPIGPNGETIIDYSIHDGIQAGFGKVVFVIRHYFEEAFREKVASKFDGVVETAYTYQELDAGLGDFKLPAGREKPWGTGHAILISEEAIQGPFAVVNADDYYGPNAFKIMVEFLTAEHASPHDYAMVGYTLKNTLSDYGVVSRGVSYCNEQMLLQKIVERKAITRTADGARYDDADGTAGALTGDEIVSMNLWGFQPSIFRYLQSQFAEFLADRGTESSSELYIPTVVDRLIASGQATVKVLRTGDPWFGITYREDRTGAVQCIRRLIDEGVYAETLWGP